MCQRILKMQYPKNNGITFIIAILVIGHLIGTITHVFHFLDVIRSGFINYANTNSVSPVVNGYWLSLTIIDPAIVFLLIKTRKAGVLSAFITIFINNIINSGVTINSLSTVSLHSIYNSLGNIYNGLQIAFLLFSAVTLPLFFLNQI